MKLISITWIVILFSALFNSVYGYQGPLNLKDQTRNEIQKKAKEGHQAIGYGTARKRVLGDLYLEKDKNGYYLVDVYCHQEFRRSVGPGQLPPNNEVNVEHTWPQSRFSSRASKFEQKSDLHHLFPSNSRANSTRGNHIFADVSGSEPTNNCDESAIGYNDGELAFMPPTEHKGNVARALFYFAVRYDLNISEIEEFHLRQWNLFDPVDGEEIRRNDEIEQIQGNRNPFIDNPELVSSIRNF